MIFYVMNCWKMCSLETNLSKFIRRIKNVEGRLKATEQQEITCMQLKPPGILSIHVHS